MLANLPNISLNNLKPYEVSILIDAAERAGMLDLEDWVGVQMSEVKCQITATGFEYSAKIITLKNSTVVNSKLYNNSIEATLESCGKTFVFQQRLFFLQSAVIGVKDNVFLPIMDVTELVERAFPTLNVIPNWFYADYYTVPGVEIFSFDNVNEKQLGASCFKSKNYYFLSVSDCRSKFFPELLLIKVGATVLTLGNSKDWLSVSPPGWKRPIEMPIF